MCTVTFIPKGTDGYILTSNRDERLTRPSATPPFTEHYKHYTLVYPKDPLGGGTWIASDNRNISVCLLNGAFQRHIPQYPYRHSRGLIVLDYFKFDNLSDFIDFYDLNNIEPFTLIIVQDFRLFEFRWDGNHRHLRNLTFTTPKIWSSVTLYDDYIIKKREEWFQDWLKKESVYTVENILDFHSYAGEGNKKNNVMMERDDHIKTISITSIFNTSNRVSIYYKDIINKQEHKAALTSNVVH